MKSLVETFVAVNDAPANRVVRDNSAASAGESSASAAVNDGAGPARKKAKREPLPPKSVDQCHFLQ